MLSPNNFENFFRVRSSDGPIVMGLSAWEVAAHWSHVDFTDNTINSGVQNNATLGLIGISTPILEQFEYIVAVVDRTPANQVEAQMLGMRFAIDI